MALLEVDNLDVRFDTPDGEIEAVRSLSFALERRETLGIVGESGSGKSQSVLSLMGLLAANGRATGRGIFDGRDLLALSEPELRRVRGRRISMIFQDPMTSLNPYLRIADQMTQALRAHERVSKRAARARCIEMLEAVRISEAKSRIERYPHELSGGMRQRVMVAASLLLEPELLIADEPTTALDVTVQAQILDLMASLRENFGTAIILITHDLGVVAGLADRVLVMNEGELVEQGRVDDIFHRPRHAYTRRLLAAVPRLDTGGTAHTPARTDEHAGEPLLEIDGLKVHFPVQMGGWLGGRSWLKAVDGVDLDLKAGETLGVVGESGCGKSTLARAILNLVPATAGSVTLLGRSLVDMPRAELRASKRDLQVVFQDPLASLNPRMTVGDIVAEPLWTHRPELDARAVRAAVADVLKRVGLTGREINRFPHEFSGGQCQRIGIARALVLRPKLIICDEPVSALDVSIQAQIVELLLELRHELGVALVFIAHDLAVVRQLSHRVAVMYLGVVVELGSPAKLYERPSHPYTRALISAVPIPDPAIERGRERELLAGELPSPVNTPSGCRFRTRCRYAIDRCVTEVPPLRPFGDGLVACHRAEHVAAESGAAPR